MKCQLTRVVTLLVANLIALAACHSVAAEILAGTAKVDITDYDAGPVNDPLFVKALVLKQDETMVAILSVDAVAIGEIGRIGNDYLPAVRSALQDSIGLLPNHILINASHCHGVVHRDVAGRTVECVQQAARELVPVQVGVGRGHENRIMENRRLLMKSGREIDVRHAYSMPPDDEVAKVGPTDSEIGLLRLDRMDGRPLAVVYNFACHPIQGVPGRRNTADVTGYASAVIEENLGEDVVAIFLQGCGGDINPVFYKDVDHPRSAEPLGNMLGLSALRGIREIETLPTSTLNWIHEEIGLPRADVAQKIIEQEAKRERLVNSLRGTTLSLKTFLPLIVKHGVSGDFPAYYSHGYLHEEAIGRDDLVQLDTENRAALKAYIANIRTMEALTRLNTNLALLRKHQRQNLEAESREIPVEMIGMRLGEFVLTTFPGELTVQIGLNIKKNSPHENTFVAGYTNGYIYYAPTTKQLENVGGAQEDSDCILAPHWQAIYEKKVSDLLNRL